MTVQERIQAFHRLGLQLADLKDPVIKEVIVKAGLGNPWFTFENVSRSLGAWSHLLQKDKLKSWLAPYPFDQDSDRTVGLVFAGNIPLVGFHDLLAVLLAGFRAQVKFSSQDQVLYQFLMDQLMELEPAFKDRVERVDRLDKFDAIIATGSDNSARYFDYYFGKYPHIIRKNRNSVAVLDGSESQGQLRALGEDIFSYYGLGCRNVSKLFLPKGYDVTHFFEGIAEFEYIRDHHKYANNYDFNKSIYLINGDAHFDNGFLLLKPAEGLASPLAVLYFQEYDSSAHLNEMLADSLSETQCIVADPKSVNSKDFPFPMVDFGQSQYPDLDDYADGVNTLEFLAGQRS